jgi:hypothetical protein
MSKIKRKKAAHTNVITNIVTAAPAYRLDVSWNVPDQLYGYQQAQADFKSCVYYNSFRSMIKDSVLQVTLAKNVVGVNGGTLSKFKLPAADQYELSFDLKFDQSFYFGAGGKIGFGFLVGEGYTGGVTGAAGGSVRLMWEGSFLKPYIYHPKQTGTWGEDFGKKIPVAAGQWYNIKMKVSSTSVRIEVNGVVLLSASISFNAPITYLCFENFRGGSEDYWKSPQEDSFYFDNISVSSATI